jgi:putative phosphoribosyl transferase
MSPPPGGSRPVRLERTVAVSDGSADLTGRLAVPPSARGVVVFAHGSGSSRQSPRNLMVAEVLQQAGLATLLFDLLSPIEAGDRQTVFNIELLARRLLAATRVARAELSDLPLGYFGASTGAAAALWAATESEAKPRAVVSRGGRPDLAWSRLEQVTAPTLLIVGAADPEVLELNRRAQARLGGEHRLEVVERATHLFEEPGTLERVAELAREWFAAHLFEALV